MNARERMARSIRDTARYPERAQRQARNHAIRYCLIHIRDGATEPLGPYKRVPMYGGTVSQAIYTERFALCLAAERAGNADLL